MSEEARAVIHRLKTWPEFFEAVLSGAKTFEWRKDDRGFDVGDWLSLVEYDPLRERLTGRWITRRVTYVLRGPDLGVPEGYVVMGLGIR